MFCCHNCHFCHPPEILHLNGNRNLQGQIDTDVLSIYPKLQKLDLSFTKFQGSIPPCPIPTPPADVVVDDAATQDNKDVNHMSRSSNNSHHVAAANTNGNSSGYLASCNTLQDLILSNTLVSGSIPTEIAYMSQLSKFFVLYCIGYVLNHYDQFIAGWAHLISRTYN